MMKSRLFKNELGRFVEIFEGVSTLYLFETFKSYI